MGVSAGDAPLRAVVADDEPLARERLRMLLTPHARWRIVAECAHGLEAVDAIVRERPDLVFLDIRMPELSGLEVAQAIEGTDRPPIIVFVTAHEEYALRAFEARALDYLLKPVDQERLTRLLRSVEDRLGHAPAASVDAELKAFLASLRASREFVRRLLVRDPQGSLYFVRTDEIEWIDARGNYAAVHVAGRAHLVRETMKALEAKLDPATFVRVHRSAIVNLDQVRRLEPYAHGEYTITLRDGSTLRTSRAHSAKLQALLRDGG